MYFDITDAKYSIDYKLNLHFADGSSGTVDFSKYIEEGTIFAKLKDIDAFKSFGIKFGTIVWGEDLDIAPETLYVEATGKDVIYRDKSSVVS